MKVTDGREIIAKCFNLPLHSILDVYLPHSFCFSEHMVLIFFHTFSQHICLMLFCVYFWHTPLLLVNLTAKNTLPSLFCFFFFWQEDKAPQCLTMHGKFGKCIVFVKFFYWVSALKESTFIITNATQTISANMTWCWIDGGQEKASKVSQLLSSTPSHHVFLHCHPSPPSPL